MEIVQPDPELGESLTREETEELYRRYGPMVLRRCRRLLRDEDAAWDALHDVFSRWLDAERDRPEFPSSYFYTMATRLCIDRIRSAAARRWDGDAALESIACADDLETRSQAGRLLDRIFGRHEADTRVMAVLYYVDGLTYEEVGDQVGLTAAGVRRRLLRLRERAERWRGGGRPGMKSGSRDLEGWEAASAPDADAATGKEKV